METAKKAANKIAEAEQEMEQRLTVFWHDIPHWLQDNHYIISGYRPSTNSYKKSFKSLSYLHNETVNIYTHLVGAVLALIGSGVIYSILSPRYESATKEDVLVFSCYFLGAIACLGMSATYHTISNHSHAVAIWGNKLDYLGIVFLIWGSFIPVLYYAFQSELHLMRTYAAMITTLAAGTSIAATHPRFRSPALRPVRALMFVAMGLSAIFPVLHSINLYGVAHMRKSIGLDWVVLQGFLYILGAGLYASRFPERIKPGRFDIWGSSHQIFHVLVVLAAASHLVGLIKAFDYEHSQRDGVEKLVFLKGSVW
ncbi:HlyIII-domain-containing protein [Lentithecium fluviatile CBS 122367]|uniref:HlyIII-domain-containing protein n=1 Tax=Lentithecium fluviatile CBS 122367 TaxID=1168545 RepID=A0A6G1JBF1_9PLEO|nr:HlyIII-domain-containing protein [Lentithecium fluviatile CBS 122367]